MPGFDCVLPIILNCLNVSLNKALTAINLHPIYMTQYIAQSWMQQGINQDHHADVRFSSLPPVDLRVSPDPFDGSEDLLKGFFLQTQIYSESLTNPKLEERQWLMFLLSQLSGSAHQWV